MSHFDLPRTLEQAREAGSKYYFTNGLCKHKHLAHRYTSSSKCVECVNNNDRERYLKVKHTAAYKSGKKLSRRRRQDRRGRVRIEVTEVSSGKKFPSMVLAAKYFGVSRISVWRSSQTNALITKRGTDQRFLFKKKTFIAQGKEYRNPNRFKKHN